MQSLSQIYEESNSKSLLKVTNIWGYKGLRVENVNIHNRKALIKRFSAFGSITTTHYHRLRRSLTWSLRSTVISIIIKMAEV
jgi:hypothetical protein